MPIPSLDDIRRPALELLAEQNKLLRIREVFALLAPRFNLTADDLALMLPSGTQLVWHNRVNWACYDLYRAGALDRPDKGRYRINDYGRQLIKDAPARLTRTYLSTASPSFASFVESAGTGATGATGGRQQATEEVTASETTPEETIDTAVEKLGATLRADLLEQLHKVDPFRFEQIVLDLLVAMGYGGSREEAARRTKSSNDEGIDGVINEDRLGLDSIYVQAKRWQAPVGRPDIQGFVGALVGARANKGVFITTSSFSQPAIDFAAGITQRVILIDGQRLADLMIEHGVGVSTVRTVAIKRLDSDYFGEE